MGILDDAIREHLDLKRKHGAREAELREIEDEALGSGDQPDPFSAGGELFGEVSPGGSAGPQGTTATEEPPAGLSRPDTGGEEPTRLVEQEALRPDPEAPPSESDLISPEPESPGIEQFESPEPATPEPVTPEPETSEPEAPGPSESLEELIAEEEPFPEDIAAPPSTPLPEHTPLPDETPLPEDTGGPPPVSPDQESLDVPAIEPDEAEEPPLEPADSVPDPPPPPPDTGPEPPGRARGRVDIPTQEHPPPGETGGLPPLPSEEPELEAEPGPPPAEEPFGEEESTGSGEPALYDFESDEDSTSPGGEPAPEPGDEFEALGPAEEEAPYLEEEEPYAEEQVSGTEPPPAEAPAEAPPDEPSTAVRPSLEEDDQDAGPVGEPYEEGEDEDDLWFEKGPPKDFDFDD